MEAKCRKARALRLRHSQSLASRRQRFSQAYGAFDNPALRQDREALGLIGPLDDLHPDAAADAAQTRLELRPLIAAVGVKLEQKRVQPEEGGHDHHATVTALHVGCMHEGVHQQPWVSTRTWRF